MGIPQFSVLRTHFPERQREARTGVFGCAWTWALCGPRFYLVNEEARGLSSSWWGRLCAVASRRAFPVGLGGASAPGRRPLVQTLQDMGLRETRGNRSALLPGQLLLTQARRPESRACLGWSVGRWPQDSLGGAARGEHDLAACAGTGWRKTQLKSCFVVCFCFLFLKILVISRWWPNCGNYMMLVFLRVFSPMLSSLCSGILTLINLRIAGGGQKGLASGCLGELRPSPSLLSPGARHTELA